MKKGIVSRDDSNLCRIYDILIKKVKKQKRKAVEFQEYAIYLFINTSLYPKEFKGNSKDAYKRAR